MRTSGKTTFAFVLVFFLLLTAVLCCCVTQTAKAGVLDEAGQGTASGSRCCADKPVKANSGNHQECACEKTAEVFAVGGFSASQAVNAFDRFLNRTDSASAATTVSAQESAQNNIPRVSIQTVKNGPPIYLQDSALRI